MPASPSTSNIAASLAPDMQPDFYRAWYPDLAKLSDQQLLAHWLLHGSQEGRLPTFKALLKKMGLEDDFDETQPFDAAFYADYYTDLGDLHRDLQLHAHYAIAGKKEGRYPTLQHAISELGLPHTSLPSHITFGQIQALNASSGVRISSRDIIASFKGESRYPIQVSNNTDQNSDFYLTIAKEYLQRHLHNSARNLLRASLFFKKDPIALEYIGNTYFDEGDFNTAQAYYEKAITTGTTSKWVHSSYATCLQKTPQIKAAVSAHLQGALSSPDFTLLYKKLDESIAAYWDSIQGKLDVLCTLDLRDELVSTVTESTQFIYDTYFSSIRGSGEARAIKQLNLDRVLIIADHHIQQCIRYRVTQKQEQLKNAGIEVTVVDWETVADASKELAIHDVVIFYRVPAIPSVVKAIATTNAMGKLSFYEIDDLIFDPAYPPSIETYGGYVDLATYDGLLKGMALFHAAARMCRYGIASTNPLKQRLSDLVFGKECILHRNGLDSLNEFSLAQNNNKSTVDIFYGSGTKAHNTDFLDQVLPALDKLLPEHPKTRLIVVGYLSLPTWFTKKHSQQIRQLPPTNDIKVYWALLQQADINIAVLHRDAVTDCKSELKWFEAACFGIPSVLSTTSNYEDVVVNGADGLLVSSPTEWYSALHSLIVKPDLRKKIGIAARERIVDEYSTQKLGSELRSQLNRVAELAQIKRTKHKKIAVVNVFFPPQSIGGATRVVADTVDEILKNYNDEFELCAFTSQVEEAAPHQLDFYLYNGIRVYRSTIKYRENMDWHPRDQPMEKIFELFLEAEKPDLVHFHCVQRLTASIVEATKKAGIPYVVTAHDAWWISDHQFLVDSQGTVYPEGRPDIYTKQELPNNVTFTESIERSAYLKNLLNSADFVLAVSERFANIYKKNGIRNVKTNKNGLAPRQWKNRKTAPDGRLVCAHIGGMASHKGFPLFKKAIEIVQPKNIEVLVVDHSRDEGYRHPTFWGPEGTSHAGVPVTYIGKTKQESIADLYANIDVLFCPSTWPESFGLVSREANAAGCWVIASNLGGIGEDIVEGETGYIIEPTLDKICETIEILDQNPSRYKERVMPSKIRTVEEQVAELVSYYETVLNKADKG
jgi:glycosyltransferase involved in cell wall biosynthesis